MLQNPATSSRIRNIIKLKKKNTRKKINKGTEKHAERLRKKEGRKKCSPVKNTTFLPDGGWDRAEPAAVPRPTDWPGSRQPAC